MKAWLQKNGVDPRLILVLAGIMLFMVFVTLVTLVGFEAVTNPKNTESLLVSLVSSFWEDAVFLLCVGIFATLITIGRPEKEIIQNRIKWFFNGKNVSEEVLSHLVKELKKAGIYSTSYKTTIIYSQIDTEKEKIKATIQSDRIIKNMFSDQKFPNEIIPFKIGTDRIGPETEVQGEFLSWYIGASGLPKHSSNPPIQIFHDGHEGEVSFDIDGDAEVIFGYRFWLWHKLGEPYSVVPAKYAERIELLIVNSCDSSLEIECGLDGKRIVLTSGGDHSYEFKDVPANERKTPFKLLGVKQ